MCRGRLVGSAVLAAVLSTGVASAHEVGLSRFEAPLPPWLLFAGAGLTVAATAGWLAVSGRAGAAAARPRHLVAVPRAVAGPGRAVARGLFLLAFAGAVAAGLGGPQVRAENFATVFVWPVWLKGVALVAALLGSPWRVLSPWRTVYAGLTRLEGDRIALRSYPARLGEWPALVGFLVWIGVLENLTAVPRSPRLTAAVVAAYAALMLLGGAAFGPAWFARADALAVLYRLFGRVAPLDATRDDGGYALALRPPWRGCTDPVRNRALVGFAVAAVYTVSFDGFTSTPEFQTALFAVRDATGLGSGTGVLLYLFGFLAFVAVFALASALADRAGGGRDPRAAACAFAPTVLPIAVAYEVAHNYPFVVGNLGRLDAVLARHLVASPPAPDPLGWLSLPAFWASQVLLIVGGHVVAVVAAHYVTVGRYATRRLASRAHAPLAALMVGYTVLSLWIVSRPVVS